MHNSFGTNPLASNPLGGAGRRGPTYSRGHLLVLGGVDVGCGLIALVWPAVTVLALALIFGLLLLLGGLLVIGVGMVARRAGGNAVAAWVIGGIAILAGLICIFHPGLGIWAIAVGCAVWFLMTGIGDLFVAAASPAHRIWFGILGVLSIIASVVLLIHPGVAIATVALVAGIAFLIRGAGELALGWRMRSAVR